MFRLAILTAALVAGTGATVSAQPYPRIPPRTIPAPAGIEGIWFMSGDPFKPCSIQSFRGPFGPILVLTNEKGQQSRARLLLNGRRIIADDWEPGSGGLVGDIRGNRIRWHNGTDWLR